MFTTKLSDIETWDSQSDALNVIVETPRGSRAKIDYDPERGLFQLSKLLPRGAVFPFNFGFIPSTRGEDGDPLDVLVLMDEPLTTGCLVTCRLLGALKAEQTEDGETVRNDRLIAVVEACQAHEEVRSVNDLNKHVLKDIEHFFVSYNEAVGKRFRPLRYAGPRHAEKLVRKAKKRFAAADGEGEPLSNGRAKASQGK